MTAWIARVSSFFRHFLHRRQREQELDEELCSVLELLTEQKMREGMDAEEARRAARIELGGVEQIKEQVREVRTGAWLDAVLQDVRFGLRMLRKNPGFTIVAVLTLALGIGANTAIFAIVDAVILRSLPVRQPESLVLLGPGDQSGYSDDFPSGEMHLFSFPMYREIQRSNRVFAGVAAFRSEQAVLHGTVNGNQRIEPIVTELVSGTYFNVLGVHPLLGRVFSGVDDREPDAVAVINYDWWNSRFSKNASVIGETLTISGDVYTIIAVAPPGFFGTTVGRSPDVWIPLQMNDRIFHDSDQIADRTYSPLDIIARLKPGVGRTEAAADVNVVLKNILHDYAGPRPSDKQLQDIRDAHVTLYSATTGNSLLRPKFSQPLWTLMVIVGLVLLIACVNIANLLLARSKARQKEFAVRMAIGAPRRRLIRQLLTECVLLSAGGGALGIGFAFWGGRFLVETISRTQNALALDTTPDIGVLAFTVAVSLGCAFLFGLFPAMRSTAPRMVASLKESRGSAAGGQRDPFARALIVSQVSLSLVLLVAAGLFIETLINLANVQTGFTQDGVLLFKLDPSATGYTDESRLAGMYREIENRVDALPGVTASSFSIYNFHQGGWNGSAWAEGDRSSQGTQHDVSYNVVGPGYFAAMGIPLLVGRTFGPQDTAISPRVAVINQTMARRLFPGLSPIGKRFGGDPDHADIEVIGVARDAKYYALDEAPEAFAYYPYVQYRPDWGIGLYLPEFEVRYSGDPQTIASDVRQVIAAQNSSLPIEEVRSLGEQVDASLIFPHLIAELSAFFGILAAFLACLGIYGLASYSVGCRTSEIGIRMALGARRGDVFRLMMSETMVLVTAGVAIGIPVSLASGRWAASMLYGLKPYDPITLLAAAALLLIVAMLAGFLPARRAMRVDPMVALRHE